VGNPREQDRDRAELQWRATELERAVTMRRGGRVTVHNPLTLPTQFALVAGLLVSAAAYAHPADNAPGYVGAGFLVAAAVVLAVAVVLWIVGRATGPRRVYGAARHKNVVERLGAVLFLVGWGLLWTFGVMAIVGVIVGLVTGQPWSA
jgi:hypothetical protein